MRVEAVLERRRARQRELIDRAREFVAGLRSNTRVRAAVVFGSVTRGDVNLWSDIAVLVVPDDLRDRVLDRLSDPGPRPPLVQPVAWTPDEWRTQLGRGNPIAREALEAGVWLVGSPDEP
ncbi:MAG: nucleotidyltransferase domain-containing protein [Gemmatimonadaceae bacterium]